MPRRLIVFPLLLILTVVGFTSPLPARSDDSSPGHFLEVENGKIYYEECGSGPNAVVLIHDGIAHSAVWDGVWPAFCKEFHTIRYDRRGYGKSPAATSWYYETDDLYTLLRQLKVSHAFLVGSSHGGELSIDFTLAHPKLVDGMVLVGAVVSGYGYSDHFLNRGVANSKPVEKNDSATTIANWANDKYLLAADHPEAKKMLHDILTAAPQDLNHPDFPRPTLDALPRLGEISVPTLVVAGERDAATPLAASEALTQAIRKAKLVKLHGAPHMMQLEHASDFNAAVGAFLSEQRDRLRVARRGALVARL